MKNYVTPFELATGNQYRAGNQVEILQNGNEIFPSMLSAIREATNSVEFVTYVYWRSRVANDFADALCERAKAGVSVRVLIDAVGGAIMSAKMVAQMERAGVQVAWFRPLLNFTDWRHLNHRTHRKILIVDGKIGFTGGVGIADEWGGNAAGPGSWRETHVRITGPACADLHAGFAENWLEASGERLRRPPVPDPTGNTAILTTVSGVGPRPTSMERLFEAAIATASERLWITSAYFIPNPDLVMALAAAVARGVDVRVLTNGDLNNHKSALYAGRATYTTLIASGVKIYEYQRTVLHAKLITVDRQWVTLGSTNFDNRSLVLNEELNISIADPVLVTPLDRQFLEDLKVSRHIRTAYWHRRGYISRLLENTSRAFSHQL